MNQSFVDRVHLRRKKIAKKETTSEGKEVER